MGEFVDRAVNNPDFFTTIILVGFIFLFFVPVFWFMLKGQRSHNEAIIFEIKEGFRLIALSQNKVKLTDIMILDIAKQKVWYASEAKLAFIRAKLEKNNLEERREKIRSHITDELNHQSYKYVNYLNQFQISIGLDLVLVGDYIEKNFDTEGFLKEIFDVVFRDTLPSSINVKINDCRFVMRSYQNSLFEKLRKDMRK